MTFANGSKTYTVPICRTIRWIRLYFKCGLFTCPDLLSSYSSFYYPIRCLQTWTHKVSYSLNQKKHAATRFVNFMIATNVHVPSVSLQVRSWQRANDWIITVLKFRTIYYKNIENMSDELFNRNVRMVSDCCNWQMRTENILKRYKKMLCKVPVPLDSGQQLWISLSGFDYFMWLHPQNLSEIKVFKQHASWPAKFQLKALSHSYDSHFSTKNYNLDCPGILKL